LKKPEIRIEKLPYLRELGINAIQIMPPAEFAGGFSWGYNPSNIFAIESDYGGPKSLKKLISTAHRLGIAVIFDVIYNHLGPKDLDLWQFDGWQENGKGGIYFFDERRHMYTVRDAIYRRYNTNAFERVIYTESHDEVANGKARVPEEIRPKQPGSYFARKRSTLGAALVFTSPGIPMIFQGQEFVEDEWFHDTDPIDWQKKETYSGILLMYRDLIRLRRNWFNNTRGPCAQYVSVHHVNNKDKIIGFHRWETGGPGDDVMVVVNMANRGYQSYTIGFPRHGLWKVRFNNDWDGYSKDFGNHFSYDTSA
jgi:1,4-alpha-glucan branching enzyme